MMLNYKEKFHQVPSWWTNYQPQIRCEHETANQLPTGLFTIAIFINATRWFHLVQINLEQKQVQDAIKE
jgi:hypothetical protein